MADDEEYIDVDAVVRMRKGERLADSKKTKGWSRGYTAKSSAKGPAHVEIRLKDDDESLQPEPEPQVVNMHNEPLPPRTKTREQEEFDQALRDAVKLAIIKAAEVAVPHIKQWWLGQALPFFIEKREEMRKRWAHRKALREAAHADAPTVIDAVPLEEVNEVSHALETYETNMSSDKARRHLAELLTAQHFINEKKRLLTNARIEDGAFPPELAASVQALTSKQVENALDSLLASQPTLLLDAGRSDSPLQLGSERMKEDLRLTDEQA